MQEEQNPDQTSLADTPHTGNSKPTGVGGWLWVPIVGFILGPIFSISLTLTDLRGAEKESPHILELAEWSNYKIAVWVLLTATCAISITAGYRLWKDHRPKSVMFAIWALWLCGPGMVVADAIAAGMIINASANDVLLISATQFPRALVAPLLWTFYLKFSRRVRNTYYGHSAAS